MADNTALNSGSGGDTIRDKDRSGVKTHFVLVDFSGVFYEISARQYDGWIGQPSPVVRRERTRDRDLVAKVAQGGRIKGYLYDPNARNFIPDDFSTAISDSALRALATVPGQEVTYTCVPPGSGSRIAFSQ